MIIIAELSQHIPRISSDAGREISCKDPMMGEAAETEATRGFIRIYSCQPRNMFLYSKDTCPQKPLITRSNMNDYVFIQYFLGVTDPATLRQQTHLPDLNVLRINSLPLASYFDVCR